MPKFDRIGKSISIVQLMIKNLLNEFEYFLKEWVGRPNPLYFAEELTKKIGWS